MNTSFILLIPPLTNIFIFLSLTDETFIAVSVGKLQLAI